MKEIDFLPKWYKSDKQRQIGYRRQYIGLACIFVVMIIWNFIFTRSISNAEAELAETEVQKSTIEHLTHEFAGIKNETAAFNEKASILRKIDSDIDIASVIAELSFLVTNRVALSKVDITARAFETDQKAGKKGSGLRAAGGAISDGDKLLTGNVRFKIVINGVAADASDVAQLICKMEDSPYFMKVYPSFSRNKAISPPADDQASQDYQVSEFEISCFLANYK